MNTATGHIPIINPNSFAGEDEVLEIKHRASSNMIFAKGAVMACKYLIDK
ncbi:dihydrodipicolinate reductase C-terminal domain-containing protein, partial [Paraclostridium sordellii]